MRTISSLVCVEWERHAAGGAGMMNLTRRVGLSPILERAPERRQRFPLDPTHAPPRDAHCLPDLAQSGRTVLRLEAVAAPDHVRRPAIHRDFNSSSAELVVPDVVASSEGS
jgi:hypothetical protein